MPITLTTPVQYLKGVGEKRAALYRKLKIETAGDLAYHFPREYTDLSKPQDIRSAPLFETCAVKARLTYKSGEQRIRKGLSIFKLTAEDATGILHITVFNSKYSVQNLVLDHEYIFYGKIGGSLLQKEMASPVFFPAGNSHPILPVYAQTAGLSSAMIRKNMEQALDGLGSLPETLNEATRKTYALGELNVCLRQIHFPKSLAAAAVARNRFVFEELLVLSCALAAVRSEQKKNKAIQMRPVSLEAFYASLPFTPTTAQLRCIQEATADLCSQTPMNRLVQGDVGSGKTLVAAAVAYYAYKNGAQSAMMAPTGILSEQHYHTMSLLLGPLGVKCALLTGSTKAKERREVLQGLADGSIHLCVGTHALISEGVDYQNLGLVITDEQHRFGVAQRAKLALKGEDCHVLVMSATPIPRTLSLMIYGDLQLSILDEMPPGRKPVDTFVIGSDKRARAVGFIKKAISNGEQAYIVCPLIEQGEVETSLKPATDYANALAEGDLKGYRVGLLHGRMKGAEKEAVMQDFKAGKIDALVSTTVVEVGVDVPNASIILIENAEQFGLSQLHQLRGRVGRGTAKSYCILVSDAKGETAKKRLRALKEISDGFQLAEYDLQLRGPGDFFGERQHGLPELKVASLADNLETMQQAQECAMDILRIDPGLDAPDNQALRRSVQAMLETVGNRPN